MDGGPPRLRLHFRAPLPAVPPAGAGTRGSIGAPLLARLPDGQGWGVVGVNAAGTPDIALGHAAPASVVGPLP